MLDYGKDSEMMCARREKMLETAWRLFSEKSIDAVSMTDIAESAECGRKTLYRYFENKPELVVAVAAWKLGKFRERNKSRRKNLRFDGMTAAEIFEFYLDSFIEMYRKDRDLLRFNQFFNVYVKSENLDDKTLRPYNEMILKVEKHFRDMYQKAQKDHTLKTDEPEQMMFSKTLHLMLAVVTRYAVGLIYIPEDGFDVKKELEFQKNMILKEYRM